ncbi:Signal transduction histidine kinase [Reichenbachiella agariperforans]|uniref:histidine kinase n=1 Tax=Reichenbachiella agariperforans TaxID=156994 RepID=A0A1M6VUQ5_REIAG|nr:two-component regulator propeller domain-containing protein [Reichenbachiella agariperforans]SHK85190.1 Signal transduction histidine kinase [Reichenbachiella agariperforans]
MKALGIYFLVNLITISLLFSQQGISDYQFVTIDQELSQNTVSAMAQDQEGFLWIGSRSGLNRYDGINMMSFMHDERDSTSLCNNYIRSLYIGTNNRVFVGSLAGGYCIYNDTDGTFGKLPTAERYPELDHVTVNAFYEDQKGNIWIATERKGLFMWRAQDQVIVQYRHNENDSWGISSNTVTGVIGDGRGNLWVSTWGGGLNLFDTNTKRFIHYRHDEEDVNSPYSNIIRCMTGGSDGHIWLGTDRGVDRVSYDDRGKYRFEHMVIKSEEDEEPFVLDLIEDKKQRLWIGSENHGLGILDTDDGAYHWYTVDSKKEYSIKNNSIWSLFEDQKGVIWVGTFNKGIFKLDEGNRKFPVYKHNPYDETSLTHNAVSSFYEDKKGNVWIGTDGGGLDYWDTEAESFTHYRKDEYPQMSNQVLSVMIDSQENVWVGNWQGGALVKRKGSSTFKKFKLPPGIKVREGRENVFSIREDQEGKLWFAVFRSGIQVYDPKTETFEVFTHDEDDEQSLSSNLTRYIFEDSKGRFWIGTEGGGLNVLEDPSTGVFRRFNHSADDTTTISDNTVQCVLEDNQGNIWVGTSGGVNLYNPENDSFTRYGYDEGFADVVIHSILSDDKGMLWMSTNKGLVRFDPETGKVRNFDLNDGLQSMEFFKHSSFKLSTGALLFGGVDGFNVIHPAQVSDVFEEPKVYLVDFKVSNESIKNMAGVHLEKGLIEGGQVRLNYDQNDFDFEFAQINFSQTSKNEYAYRLKNYDKTWQQAGNRREAYYTNVPPGSYTFEVRGTDNGGEWSSQEASFSLVVDPPWYASVWAYVLYSMFLLGVLYWAFQVIINRERLQTKLMVEHMELSKMQELDQMKSSFFANISHEFRSPLTLILGPLKAMIEKKNYVSNEEQVHMMLRNAENLLNLINQLLELSKLESGKMRLELVTKDVTAFLKPIVHSFSSLASRNNMAYKVVMPKGAVELSFDKDKLEKIVVNLLSNAFKYTNDYGKVTVSLREEEDKVVLEVKDDGIGIPQEDQDYIFNRYYRVRDHKSRKSKGTGIGLSLTKELVELHHGHIAFKSEENEGTSFEVHLFKGTMHFEAEDFELEDEQVAPISANQGIYEIEESLYKSASSNDQIAEEEDKKLPLILVTEDNTDIRLYIKSILEEEYRVIQAEDGNDGVSKAQEFIPDLIISDVMMPGKDGLELCEEIKSNVKTSHIPVILLTAKASNDSALTGFELGADYYITKPFNPKLLSLRVRNALKTRDQIRGQLLNKSTFNINPKNVKIASRDEEFIAKAVAVIEENISNSEFYVDDLGRELGMSRMQLYRKLKGLIGQSANEFIRSIRLKRAAQLIRQDELNISEITYQVGFNDLQYFRDCFKKQYGVNPSEYAQDVKEKIN